MENVIICAVLIKNDWLNDDYVSSSSILVIK